MTVCECECVMWRCVDLGDSKGMSGIGEEPVSGYSGPLVVVQVHVSMWLPDKSAREEHRHHSTPGQHHSTPLHSSGRKEGGALTENTVKGFSAYQCPLKYKTLCHQTAGYTDGTSNAPHELVTAGPGETLTHSP